MITMNLNGVQYKYDDDTNTVHWNGGSCQFEDAPAVVQCFIRLRWQYNAKAVAHRYGTAPAKND